MFSHVKPVFFCFFPPLLCSFYALFHMAGDVHSAKRNEFCVQDTPVPASCTCAAAVCSLLPVLLLSCNQLLATEW